MGQSSDELRQEIDARRESAAAKIDDLQAQVMGTADDLKAQATGTVEELKTQVQDTVQGTIDTVKENIDLESKIRERPIVSLGVALIGGMIAGGMMGKGGSGSSYERHAKDGDYDPKDVSFDASSSSRSSGRFGQSTIDTITDSLNDLYKSTGLEDTINSATAAFMGSMTEQVKQMIDKNVPGFAEKLDVAKKQDGSIADKTTTVNRY